MSALQRKLESDNQTAFYQIESPGNGVHQFIKNISHEYPFLDVDAIKLKFFRAVAKGRAGIDDVSSIQNYMHRVWLTNKDDPRIPEEKYLAVVKEGISRIPSSWKVIFWTNSEVVADFVSEFVGDARLEVRNPLDRSWDFSLIENIKALIEDKKYAFACDQLRIEIIFKFGGVYCDMGVRFMEDITSLLNDVRYVFLLGNGLFFQNSFFGAPKGDPLYKRMVDIQLNPYDIPRKLIGSLDATTEGWIASGLMITFLYLLMSPESVSARVFRANGQLIQWGSQRSWYQPSATMNGPSDSAIVEETEISLIDPKKWESENRGAFC